MYESGYDKIFWGMIFIIFDINLGYINILPNFIGYGLIYSGLNILLVQHEVFKKGKMPATILILLTLKDIFHNPNNTSLLEGINLQYFSSLMGSLVSIINLYLIYIISKGIYELCEKRELKDLRDNIKSCWKFYFVISVISLFYMPFIINIPVNFREPIIIVGGIQLVASICITVILRKCRVGLRE